jgi:hypothetical protein
MEFKLSNILESTVLLEGRKEDAIKKYGEQHTSLINNLSSGDPSGNNKYLNWMARQVITNGENQTNIIRVTTDFHSQLPRIKNKDINSYKTYRDLKTVVDEALDKAEEKSADKEADKVYEDNEVVIYAPLTVRASCKYGAGSKWCITGKSGSGASTSYNDYYDRYSKDAVFYFFLRKNVSQSQDSRGYKWALQYSHNGSQTWWDAEDSSHRDRPRFVTEPMMAAVNEYNKSAVANKLQRQIKSFLTQPTINKYKDFRDHLTPEQRERVIRKIIGTGDLNNNTFRTLAADLNDEQKNNFIEKYVVGKVTASDYINMKEHLNNEQTLKLVSYNPSILNNSDIIKSVDERYNDDQKFELSQKLDGKLITNTDSKVLVKKWSMTPEQRKAHGQNSFYVFLSDENAFIQKLNVVNPLDPDSYRKINMLKLNKSLKPGISLYGIKTPHAQLDEYIDKSSKDIPEEVLNTIRQGARRIE